MHVGNEKPITKGWQKVDGVNELSRKIFFSVTQCHSWQIPASDASSCVEMKCRHYLTTF